jgi:High potential iron-sulfur protein
MKRVSRREALAGIIVLPALAAIAVPAVAAQSGKASKEQYAYQAYPHDGERCANCKVYHAGKTPSSPGSCDLVQGSISPNGWCRVFVARGN